MKKVRIQIQDSSNRQAVVIALAYAGYDVHIEKMRPIGTFEEEYYICFLVPEAQVNGGEK